MYTKWKGGGKVLRPAERIVVMGYFGYAHVEGCGGSNLMQEVEGLKKKKRRSWRR